MGQKGKKRGQIGIISASEAKHLSAHFSHSFFFTISPKAEHGSRLTEGKIYVAICCVEVNGDILTECPLEDGRRPFSTENVASLEVWQIKTVCEIIYDLVTIIYDNVVFSLFP